MCIRDSVQIADGILAFCQRQVAVADLKQYGEKRVVVTFSEKVPAACWAGLPIDRRVYESSSSSESSAHDSSGCEGSGSQGEDAGSEDDDM